MSAEHRSPAGESELLQKARCGDMQALAELFLAHRDRLRRMVQLRMDWRLKRRLDPSDVVQEAWLDYTRRISAYCDNQPLPFYLWLRQLTAQRLIDVHRRHLGAKMRNIALEASIWSQPLPPVTSHSLASQLLGRLTTASQAAQRAEDQIRVQQALDRLKPVDREVIALRHFEILSNDEAALVLGLSKTAASNRYIRAMQRLREELIAAGIEL